MKKTFIIFSILSFYFSSLFSQTSGSKQEYVRLYTQAQVLDSTEGILIYTRMMKVLQMDYDLLNKEGSVVQGWNEEYFDNGQLMHISYYKEGKLVLFKNFYENGQCEHNITYPDAKNCNIDVYFENGSLKNQLNFSEGLPKKMSDFFASGLPKSQLEFDKEAQCVSSKRTWFLNAEIQSELVIVDASQKKYNQKTFYPNGQIKEEGDLLYSTDTKEYIKTGTWLTFESSGKKKSSEKFKFSLSSK